MLEDEFKRFAGKHQKLLESHESVDVISLLDKNELVPHLKEVKVFKIMLIAKKAGNLVLNENAPREGNEY